MKKDTDDKHPSSAFTSFPHKLHLKKKKTLKKGNVSRAKTSKCIWNVNKCHIWNAWRSYRVINQKCEVLVQDVSANVVTTGESSEYLVGWERLSAGGRGWCGYLAHPQYRPHNLAAGLEWRSQIDTEWEEAFVWTWRTIIRCLESLQQSAKQAFLPQFLNWLNPLSTWLISLI